MKGGCGMGFGFGIIMTMLLITAPFSPIRLFSKTTQIDRHFNDIRRKI